MTKTGCNYFYKTLAFHFVEKRDDKRKKNWISWGIMLLLGLVWGSSFILIKKSLVAFSSYQVGVLRIGISALAFLPIGIQAFRKIKRSDLKWIILVGLAGSGIPSFLFPLAQTQISSSIAGLLNSLTPLFTLVLGILFFNTDYKFSKVAGVLIGLLGASLLILFGESFGENAVSWYSLFAVLATVCYATSVNTVGTHLQHLKPITTSATSFIIIGVPALVYILFSDIPETVTQHPQGYESLTYVLILALLGTVLSTVIFFQLVRISNALIASMIAYIIPIVALGWGALDGELISLYHFVGMGLILVGVYLSRK